jgi:hypothetical protein
LNDDVCGRLLRSFEITRHTLHARFSDVTHYEYFDQTKKIHKQQ